MKRLPVISICLAATLALSQAHAAGRLDGLSDDEKALADSVDHWGLAFGDQLTRFTSHFASRPDATFAVGVTHDVVKILPNKFWFRGQTFLPGPERHAARELIGCEGETLSFQVAVLSGLGQTGGVFEVRSIAPSPPVTVFRQVFLKCPAAPYPRMSAGRWPDPLVPARQGEAGPVDVAAFWVDVEIPRGAGADTLSCRFEVLKKGTDERVQVDVPVTVVRGIQRDPRAFPVVAWFTRKSGGIELSDTQFLDMCRLVLDHQLQPLGVSKWDPADAEAFDREIAFRLAHGQRLIQIDRAPAPNAKPAAVDRFDALYEHLKEKQWLRHAVSYSNADEPDPETFRTKNVPFMQHVRKTYPGLRVFLAAELHEGIGDGCDIVMTDLSSEMYDPREHVPQARPELWHYYCHLPVRWQMRAPLVRAPNMQVDNAALEHRLAVWMSHRFGAKGLFIWAGNREWDKMQTIWADAEIKIPRPYKFPYGGVHNGNGILVYPPREPGGAVLPSVRLKVLRSGVQDVALLRACEALCREGGGLPARKAARLRELLDPVPAVFHHPHYYDQLPETLLARREAILRLLAE